MSDSQRIKELSTHYRMSINALSKYFGLNTAQTLYDIVRGRNGISKDLAEKFSAKDEALNTIWLLTGEGQMLKSESTNPTINVMENQTLVEELRDRITSLEKQLNEKQQFCEFLMKQINELQLLTTSNHEIKKKEAV